MKSLLGALQRIKAAVESMPRDELKA